MNICVAIWFYFVLFFLIPESWDSFKFQEAGKRRYCSGDDGLFGFCDVSGTFITKLSLWNHKDEIIKERLFGLSGTEVVIC